MLLRWLILRLCASMSDVRLIVRTVRQYRVHLEKFGPGKPFVVTDRRIVRRNRMSMLIGILFVHVQSPALVGMAIWAIPAAVGLGVWRLASWVI